MTDFKTIHDSAYSNEDKLVQFLRDIVAIPSLSGQEEDVVKRIAKEMELLDYDEVIIDPLGNVMGRIGNGPRVVAFDAHIDTVDVGDLNQWSFDPHQGKLEDGKIYGRGAVDQKAGMAAMVYAGRMIRELGLGEEFTVWMVGSVMEEDCDGLCWHYILNEKKLQPELVISTEPTNLTVTRGHRGRMEIRVTTSGVSCHGSAPERGDNAVTKLAPACAAIAELNNHLANDDFLGKGSCTVTMFESQSPSLCAVPDKAELHIDRRLTIGETKESSIAEVETSLKDANVDAKVWLLTYEEPAWTGLVYPMEKYYPTWVMPEDNKYVQAGAETFNNLFNEDANISCWTFSTNGVAINGLYDVPCIGFGPGEEKMAHAKDEYVPVEDLIKACAFYAGLVKTLEKVK